MAQPIKPPRHAESAITALEAMYRRDQFEAQQRTSMASATAETARETAATKDLLKQLVAGALASEAREAKMLFWARVAGIGALLALAISVIGIAVTVAMG